MWQVLVEGRKHDFENFSKFLTNIILLIIPALVAMVLAICGYLGKYFSTNSSLVISLNKSLPFLTTKYCSFTVYGKLDHSLIVTGLVLYVWFI